MAKERKIDWDATFEIPCQPTKAQGPGGGTKYQLSITALVMVGKREREFNILSVDKSKSKVGDKAIEQCFNEIVEFINSGLRRPLTEQERWKIANQLLARFLEEANKSTDKPS